MFCDKYKSNRVIFFFLVITWSSSIQAQVAGEPIPGLIHHNKNGAGEKETGFRVSLGYGFPNVDQSYLPKYYSYTRGGISQAGPVMLALNYQFNRTMSAGIMVTHGTVGASYQATSDTLPITNLHAKFINSAMFATFVRYFPGRSAFTPYTKTAIGINLWRQKYSGTSESTATDVYNTLPLMAWQGAIGVQLRFYKSAKVFAELGYGKYIVNSGLAFGF